MKLINILGLHILLCGTCLTTQAPAMLKCGKGQHVRKNRHGTKICATCPPGTFISLETHSLRRCNYCTIPLNLLRERLLKNCTPFSDTQIGCHEGYARVSYGYIDVLGKSYGKCIPDSERSLTCGTGQYIQYTLNRVKCAPCPSGTFNSKDNHKNQKCTKCKKPRRKRHERMVRPCISTSDTVIGCQQGFTRVMKTIKRTNKVRGVCMVNHINRLPITCGKGFYVKQDHDGYYRRNDKHQGIMRAYGSCEKCSICWQDRRHEIKPCRPFRDTICSKRRANYFICGKGQYVTYENERQVCAACPSGTFNSKRVHNYTDCAYCTKADTSLHELELEKCTPTSDTVIGCQAGYFREVYLQEGEKIYGDCNKCSFCAYKNMYEIEACGPNTDAVCSSTLTCPKGHFVETFKSGGKLSVCKPCQPGTFISIDNHTFTDCARCTRPDEFAHERTLVDCTPTSDTVIGCKSGYFWRTWLQLDMKTLGACDKCSSCEYQNLKEITPCGPQSDTVCGPMSKLSYTCPRGQFLQESRDQGSTCNPCPPGTFISTDNHTFTDCARCTRPEESNHELILTDCTPTSDTVIGCKSGYFRKSLLSTDMKIYGECDKCSSCEYQNLKEITPCGPKSDTVCGPMSKLLVTCPKGQFLQESRDLGSTCKPCPPGTFISTDNHKFTDCARCTQSEEFAHELTLKDCTPTSDTVIGCTTGYFRKPLLHSISGMSIYGDCWKCSSCEQENKHVITPCTSFSDTVCG